MKSHFTHVIMCHLSHPLILPSYKFALYSTHYSSLFHHSATLKASHILDHVLLQNEPQGTVCLLLASAAENFSKIILRVRH